MKKIIGIILIAGLAAFIATGIANKDDDKGTKTSTTETTRRPTTTTTAPEADLDAEKALACLEAGQTIADGLTTMGEGMDLLPYADAATAQEFLATAREFTQTSIETIQLCAEFAPTEAAETLTALRQLDSALASAEALY